MIVVTVTLPGAEATTHRFEGDRVRIGREHDNDLVVDWHGCSRYHAEILRGPGIYKIVDLGSTNGIKVGEERVDEYLLSQGAEVTIGDVKLHFAIPRRETPKTTLLEVGGDLVRQIEEERAAATLPPPVLYLLFRSRGGRQCLKLAGGVDYVIGRSESADVELDDGRCSGLHAKITSEGRVFMLTDLASANGTFVNGERVEESMIEAGDHITIGRTVIEISGTPRSDPEQEALLAKTQLGIPHLPQSSEGARAVEPRGGRWMLAAAGLAVLLLVVVVAVVTWRLAGRSTTEPALAPPGGAGIEAPELVVRVRPIERKNLEFIIATAGTVEAQRQITVSSEVAALVLDIPVPEGTVVDRGDLLFRLDDREIRLLIDQVRSSVSDEQLTLAREDLARKERLFADGAVTRSAVDAARNRVLSLETAHNAADAKVAQLQERASKTRVRAPIAGVVAKTLIDSGEMAAPGAPLAVIEDADEVLVTIEVSDRDVVKLRPLQVVEATTDAYSGRIFQGMVERVGSTANPATKSFEVTARIANPDGTLRSGMITSLEIQLEKKSCLVVPEEALLDDRRDAARVMVVSDGLARSVSVELGSRKDRDVELLSGLADGDQVIVYGHEQVREGQRVKTYE